LPLNTAVSVAAPPSIVSLPSRPSIVSLPPLPRSRLAAELPPISSFAAPP
jgi:hypothetical protein